MKNIVSRKDIIGAYEEIDSRLAIVSIDKADPTKRTCLHSGLNILAAFREVLELNARGVRFIVCIDVPGDISSWDLEAFRPYETKMEWWVGHYSHGEKLRQLGSIVKP